MSWDLNRRLNLDNDYPVKSIKSLITITKIVHSATKLIVL